MGKKKKPKWWLERPHKKDLTPNEPKPTFCECDVFNEYMRRGYDEAMDFFMYKLHRGDVINIVD